MAAVQRGPRGPRPAPGPDGGRSGHRDAGDSISRAKQEIRERVWALLEREHVTEPGVRGYIPAFTGAGIAASVLAGTPEWQATRVTKAVPDRAQQPVRERAARREAAVHGRTETGRGPALNATAGHTGIGAPSSPYPAP